MRCVADENVDRPIVHALRHDGHAVWYVAEDSVGLSDDEVLERASGEGALLLTSDKDFGEIVFRQGRTRAGVLLLRLAGIAPPEKARIVSEAVRLHGDDLLEAFAVLSPTALRIRKRDSQG